MVVDHEYCVVFGGAKVGGGHHDIGCHRSAKALERHVDLRIRIVPLIVADGVVYLDPVKYVSAGGGNVDFQVVAFCRAEFCFLCASRIIPADFSGYGYLFHLILLI